MWCFLGLKGLYLSVFFLFFLLLSHFQGEDIRCQIYIYIQASCNGCLSLCSVPGHSLGCRVEMHMPLGCANILQPNPVSLMQAELSLIIVT